MVTTLCYHDNHFSLLRLKEPCSKLIRSVRKPSRRRAGSDLALSLLSCGSLPTSADLSLEKVGAFYGVANCSSAPAHTLVAFPNLFSPFEIRWGRVRGSGFKIYS